MQAFFTLRFLCKMPTCTIPWKQKEIKYSNYVKTSKWNRMLTKMEVTVDIFLPVAFITSVWIRPCFCFSMSSVNALVLWKITRKYYLFCIGRTQETSAFYTKKLSKKYFLWKLILNLFVLVMINLKMLQRCFMILI